jgi:hypothetical protein
VLLKDNSTTAYNSYQCFLPKFYYRNDHLICIVEYHRIKVMTPNLNLTSSLSLEPRTVFVSVTITN